MQICVFGLSHRTAPIETLERLAMAPDQIRETLKRARGERILSEAMILSTCNRTEIYAAADDPENAHRYAREILAAPRNGGPPVPLTSGYAYRDQETVRHLLRVSAGLDSMVLGEMQILGQVKDAYGLAVEGGSAGTMLHRLLASALRVGKRSRTETELATGAVSVASASVQLASRVFGDFTLKRVLVVGAGDTGRLAAQHFAEQGPAALTVANRTHERARALAEEVGGAAIPLENLQAALEDADVVICATRSESPIIDHAMVRGAMRDRERRPLVLVDISMPRNIDPHAGRLENVFLHSIESLRTLVDQNLARRRKEIPRVEAIIEEETERFFRWSRSLEVTPLIRGLRERFEQIRAEEAERHLGRLPSEARQGAEAMSRALINRLLHHPTVRIKALDPETNEGLVALETVRALFELGGDAAENPPEGGSRRRGPSSPEGSAPATSLPAGRADGEEPPA